MIGLKIDSAKNFFFDAPRVLAAVDRATLRNLSRAGAFVRRTAKGLIRKVGKSGKPSAPGQPPKSRTGILKEFLFFVFEPRSRSVVIGPAKTNQVFFQGAGQPVSGVVPEILEYGGSISLLEWYLPRQSKWVRADLRFKRRLAERQTRLRTVTIAPRPYMQPALAKEVQKGTLANLWTNTLRAA